MKKSILVFIFYAVFYPLTVFGEEGLLRVPPVRQISKITVTGLDKTRPHVVFRELLLKTGDLADPILLEESLQRLRNLGIFSRVQGLFFPKKSGSIELKIDVEEKWTFIPIVNFGGDSGVNYFALGVIDINLLGHYMEFGSIYINFGGQDSGLLWYRDRRVGGKNLKLGFDIGRFARSRRLFESDGDESGAFIRDRRFVKLVSSYKIHKYFEAGTSLEYRNIEISDDKLKGQDQDLNEDNNFDPDESTRDVVGWVDFILGRMNSDRERQFGLLSEWNLGSSALFGGSDRNYTEILMDTRYMMRLPLRSNLGFRVKGGYGDSDRLQHHNYIGGFETIRGYRDGRYRGRNFMIGNIEYRVPSYIGSQLILQHVAFFDTGAVSDELWNVFSASDRESFNSAGIGIRLISPKIYLLSVRIDYAKAFEDQKDDSVSFGLQQYF